MKTNLERQLPVNFIIMQRSVKSKFIYIIKKNLINVLKTSNRYEKKFSQIYWLHISHIKLKLI